MALSLSFRLKERIYFDAVPNSGTASIELVSVLPEQTIVVRVYAQDSVAEKRVDSEDWVEAFAGCLVRVPINSRNRPISRNSARIQIDAPGLSPRRFKR